MTAVESPETSPGLVARAPKRAGIPGPTPLDALMDRYADGDDTAFAELFGSLAPRIRAFLRRLSGSKELADDLTQETFLRIHQARGSFARGGSAIAWAYAIARNCYISHVRSAKSKLDRASVDAGRPEFELLAGLEASAEETSIAMQSARAVERALADMTLARREAFVLVRYEGMSVATAARILGVTESALKLRAFHAYETIRKALKDLEGEEPAGGNT